MLGQFADGDRRIIVVVRICRTASPKDVVDQDQSLWSEKVQTTLVLIGVALLVCVDEGNVEIARFTFSE